MAKKSFLQRFPHFGLIMIIAVVLAIPLTVWSTKNVSTQTEQHASVAPEPYCSSFNIRDCIYGCQPTTSGGYCKSAPTPTPAPLSAPTNLSGYLSSCVKTSYGTTTGTLHLSWSKVTNATSYKITVYNSIQTINLSSTTNYYSTSSYSYATGYNLYSYVQAYNSTSKTTSSKSTTIQIKCQ